MKSARNVLAAITAVVFSLCALDAAFGQVGQAAGGAVPAQPPAPNAHAGAAQGQPPAPPPQVAIPQAQAVVPQAQAAGNGAIVGFGGGGRGGRGVAVVQGAGGGAGLVGGGGGFGGGGVGQGFVINNGQLTVFGGPVDLQTQQTINSLAARLRQLKAHENPSDDEQKQIADLTDQLRQTLDSEFKQTQKSQFDEMAQLRDRLDKLQKEIADRNKNRETLLDQRLSDLLAGNAAAVGGPQVIMFQQALQQLQPPQPAGGAPAAAVQLAPAGVAPANPEGPVAPPKPGAK